MSVLTLTPSRFGTVFADGSYAYVLADKPVRKLGVLVTPEPITVSALNGVIAIDLIPNEEVDEALDFTYTVCAFDENGSKMYIHNIVMPNAPTNLFDLIPVEQDLNTCATKTLETNA